MRCQEDVSISLFRGNNRQWNQSVNITSTKEGLSYVGLFDKQGRPRIELKTTSRGNSYIVLLDKNSNVMWAVGCENGTLFRKGMKNED